jgi:beta-ribofuranosylaminobenzene 5'-phosphate synthase
VGVAAFERGGFVLDAGHPTARFTTDRPADGDWTVPPVAARHPVPSAWRFLLVTPASEPGRSGDSEDAGMRAAVERADAGTGDRVAGVVLRRVLPAVATGSAEAFGAAVAEVGRLNGSWYADEQGGVYRPPVGELVSSLDGDPAVFGAGQSSWGPTAYGVTDAAHADAARAAGEAALEAAGVEGSVRIVAGRNRGARIEVGSDDAGAARGAAGSGAEAGAGAGVGGVSGGTGEAVEDVDGPGEAMEDVDGPGEESGGGQDGRDGQDDREDRDDRDDRDDPG